MKQKLYDLLKIVLILFVFFNIGRIFSEIFVNIGFDISTFDFKDTAYIEALIGIFLSLIVFILYYKTIIKDYNDFKINFKSNLKKCFMLFGVLLAVKVFASVVTSVLSIVFNVELTQSVNQNIIETLIGSAPVMMFISSVLVAPFIEEIIFRLGLKKIINNNKVFIIISGLIFGLMHVLPSELSLVLIMLQSIIYISLGIALACMYVENKNIFYVIIPHALNNLLGMLAALILL